MSNDYLSQLIIPVGRIVQQSRADFFFFLCWQNSSTVKITVEESCHVPGIRHMIHTSFPEHCLNFRLSRYCFLVLRGFLVPFKNSFWLFLLLKPLVRQNSSPFPYSLHTLQSQPFLASEKKRKGYAFSHFS